MVDALAFILKYKFILIFYLFIVLFIAFNWKKIEKQVFEEIQKLFGEDLSEEVYTAYLTLFERFRYNRELKFFFVPRKNGLNYINCVTIHETLHFIFFDYWNKNFKNRLQTNNLWMFSELFNVIVMNKEPFLSLAGQKSKPYPNHEAHYPKLKELFDQRSSLKEFFENFVKYDAGNKQLIEILYHFCEMFCIFGIFERFHPS